MTPLSDKQILLVDDEADVRAALAMLLVALGATVTQAGAGTQALELYQQQAFDYVCTDYKMPNMRGDALARAVKTINPQQRIAMISGFADDVLVNGRLPGFIDVLLPKPCSLQQLAEALA